MEMKSEKVSSSAKGKDLKKLVFFLLLLLGGLGKIILLKRCVRDKKDSNSFKKERWFSVSFAEGI